MLKLTIEDAVRTVINTRCGSVKRGRLKRQRVYAFHCLDCGVEVFYTRAELEHKKTAIVRCKNCSDKVPRTWLKKRPFEACYNGLILQARFRSVDIDLSYEQFLDFTEILDCHYCRRSILWQPFFAMELMCQNGERERRENRKAARVNLDRKDNAQGYSTENCVVCCGPCNRIKGSVLTYEQMMRLAPLLREFVREETDEA